MLLPSIISAKLVSSDKSKTTSNATQNIATGIVNNTSKAKNSIQKNTNISKNQNYSKNHLKPHIRGAFLFIATSHIVG